MSLEHWESYYRKGALVSCPMGLERGYTREVRDAWVGFFAALPHEAHILDIGTGNGAIPLIAKETAVALGRRFEIDAVDVARIDPAHDVEDGARLFEGIRFHAGVAAEALPFEAQTFDAVTGQYALEYTDTDRALQALHRVLKHGGRGQFILHHRDSVIVRNAQESLREAALVLSDTKVIELFRRYLEAERLESGDKVERWQQLVAAAEGLINMARSSQGSVLLRTTLDALGQLFDRRGAANGPALELALDQIEGELRASVRRLQELVGAARSLSDVAELGRSAAAAGFVAVEFRPQLHSADKLVGWRLSLAKV